VTISDIYEHYDYNARTMERPLQEKFNFERDFEFK
jgi:hypothetical protein